METNKPETYLVGIDFGHGETAASAWCVEKENLKPLKFKDVGEGEIQSYKLRSVIFKKPNREGAYEYRLEHEGIDIDDGNGKAYTINLSFKDKISELNRGENWDKREDFQAFIKRAFNALVKENGLNKDGNKFQLYIATPTSWNQEEKEAYRKFVEKATGVAVGWVINESDAAYYAKNTDVNSLILVVDYGSSTIDFTLVYKGNKIDIDRCSKDLGAQKIEIELLNEYQNNPKSNYRNCMALTTQLRNNSRNEHVNIEKELLFEIRKKKETAYTNGDHTIYFACVLANKYWMSTFDTREIVEKYAFQYNLINFNSKISWYRDGVKDLFEEVKRTVVEKCREKDIDVKGLKIVVSGGARRMPWVLEVLKTVFAFDGHTCEIIKDEKPEFVVSDGIAMYAHKLYEVNLEVANLVKELREWLFRLDSDIKEMAMNVCREVCKEIVNSHSEIKMYSSQSFKDELKEYLGPDGNNYSAYPSSILAFMHRMEAVNKQIEKENEDINEKIFNMLSGKVREEVYCRLNKVMLKLKLGKMEETDKASFLGNKAFSLPKIRSGFTVGIQNIEAVTDECLKRIFPLMSNNTKYKGFLGRGEGSYLKKREPDKRKKIVDAYNDYIMKRFFEPYTEDDLKDIKSKFSNQVVELIAKKVTEKLAFNPCGYDLKAEILKELEEKESKDLATDEDQVFNREKTQGQEKRKEILKMRISNVLGNSVFVVLPEGNELKVGDRVCIVLEGKPTLHYQLVNISSFMLGAFCLMLDGEVPEIYKDGMIFMEESL